MKLLLIAAIALSLPTAALADAQWQSKALKAVKAEKKVIDARWRMAEQNVLWVAMEPNGSPRDGFAQSLCVGLAQAANDDTLKTVFIFDPANYDDGVRAMGTAACR